MTLGETIRSLLVADATLSGLVGTRIYPNEMPEGVTLPAVVYQVISDVPENSFTGQTSTDIKTARLQVDSYARAIGTVGAYAQAHAVAAAIENVIGNLSSADLSANVNDAGRDLYDNVTQYHRVQQDFIVWR